MVLFFLPIPKVGPTSSKSAPRDLSFCLICFVRSRLKFLIAFAEACAHQVALQTTTDMANSISKYRSRTFHKFWLTITALVVGAFGPVFLLGTMPATAEPARLTLDLISWPIDGAQSYTAPTTQLLSAMAGGFLLGWALLIWALSVWVYDQAPEGVRRAVLLSLLTWFFMDSGGSVASGNPANVLFNIGLLLIAAGPLWRPALD